MRGTWVRGPPSNDKGQTTLIFFDMEALGIHISYMYTHFYMHIHINMHRSAQPSENTEQSY